MSESKTPKNNKYDIVLFGATSFVGQIISQYMINQNDVHRLSWAIAGRSEKKLSALKKQLGISAMDLPILVAQANDATALNIMCNQARVIMTTVGPYDLYGEPVVKACVETGTDYCDLTGEAHWIKAMLDKYGATAKKTGARIVHCTGFDSVPSDLGVHHLQNAAVNLFGETCDDVRLRIHRMQGSASGGTIATALNMVEVAKNNPEIQKVMNNPYALCPPEHGYTTRQDNTHVQYDEDMNSWVGPFFMAPINTRIVHRSNALSQNRYGADFKYQEGIMTGKGWAARAKARSIYLGLGAFFKGISIRPIRALLKRFVLPKPGEGPSPEKQQQGFYDFRFVGRTSNGHQIITQVYGDQDPGYGSTAKIMSQAAICLAVDVNNDIKGGFWTPATLLGDKLITRLEQHSGVSFAVLSHSTKE